MVRKLKFHEQKLLRKVDFYKWEASNNLHEAKIMKRYHIQKREEYTLYNKLYNLGLIPTKWKLELCDKINVSSGGSGLVEDGGEHEDGRESGGEWSRQVHALLVPRNLEDFVTWVNTSKIRQHVLEYKDLRDDYDVNCYFLHFFTKVNVKIKIL